MKNFLSEELLAEAPTRHDPLSRGSKIVARCERARSTAQAKRISSRMFIASQITTGIKLPQEAAPPTELE